MYIKKLYFIYFNFLIKVKIFRQGLPGGITYITSGQYG